MYGYGPLRFLAFSVVGFLLILLITYFLWAYMGITRNGHLVVSTDFSQALFYGASLTTTLGFSELVPETVFGRVYAILLAFTGIGWFGLFTAILVRRVIR